MAENESQRLKMEGEIFKLKQINIELATQNKLLEEKNINQNLLEFVRDSIDLNKMQFEQNEKNSMPLYDPINSDAKTDYKQKFFDKIQEFSDLKKNITKLENENLKLTEEKTSILEQLHTCQLLVCSSEDLASKNDVLNERIIKLENEKMKMMDDFYKIITHNEEMSKRMPELELQNNKLNQIINEKDLKIQSINMSLKELKDRNKQYISLKVNNKIE